MERLPYELINMIFDALPQTFSRHSMLVRINRSFRRILDTQQRWFKTLRLVYPSWVRHTSYDATDKDSPDWKSVAANLTEEARFLSSLKLHLFSPGFGSEHETIPTQMPKDKPSEGTNDTQMTNAPTTPKPEGGKPFSVGPLDEENCFATMGSTVDNVDPITKEGIVGIAKTRFILATRRQESRILLWEYPSGNLLREFIVNFQCRLTSIQTVRVQTEENERSTTKMTFFSLVVGRATRATRMIEQAVLIYRLLENGDIRCIAFIDLAGLSLSSIFLFSQASWRTDHRENDNCEPFEDISRWLQVLSPQHARFKAHSTLFVTTFGHSIDSVKLGIQLFQIDLQCSLALDPLQTPATWDPDTRNFKACHSGVDNQFDKRSTMAFWSSSLPLVYNRTHHASYPPQLSHLVFGDDEENNGLCIFDWRYCFKVGIIPKKDIQTYLHPYSEMQESTLKEAEDTAAVSEEKDKKVKHTRVTPKSFKIVSALPMDLFTDCDPIKVISKHGLRLIVFGSDRMFNERIQIWDITYLMNINWNALCDTNAATILAEEVATVENSRDLLQMMTDRHPWWERGSQYLKFLASKSDTKAHELLYSPPKEFQTLIVDSWFKRGNGKFFTSTAFDVSGTSIVMLLNTGELLVADIESGKTLRRLDLNAIYKNFQGKHVSALHGKQIFVTGKNVLLRGLLEKQL